MNAKSINDIIEEAWQYSENENNKKAIEILEQAKNDFLEYEEHILLQLGDIYFRDRQDLKALEAFMICYNNSKSEEVLQFLLNCYHEPNIEEYKNRYYSNMEHVNSYKHFYGDVTDFKAIKEKILWQDENLIIYYRNHEILKMETDLSNYDLNNKIIIAINEWNINSILKYEKITKIELNILTAEIPMYLYYDEQIFSIVNQLIEFQRIIEKNRIAIIVGKKQLEEFFNDTQVIFPNYILGNNIDIYMDIVKNASKRNEEYLKDREIAVKEYYRNNSLKILENIMNQPPKILFITCRFTTIVQYHTRDCINATRDMGLETDLLIEKSDIHRVTTFCELDAIYKLKPDMIFCIDHFKFEHPWIPEEIAWVTWAQDPIDHIMDKNTPSKLLDRDFVLNHLYTWQEFKNINYPKERLFDAPIPSNPQIYKPYTITEEEKEKYSCDICFVCHAANFEEKLNDFLDASNDVALKNCLKKMAYEYYEGAYTESRLYYSKEEFKGFFLELLKQWNYRLNDSILDIFVEEMHMWLNQRIFRIILVNWLIDAGYENIKLWGNGWAQQEKYKKYAMGPAQNGEQLSKIYQCSKINVGNNIVTTAAARAWESMLSGGFYMSNYIPQESDISDIRKVLKEDEFVMFYDKEDFLTKVKYYLENENKRLEMIEIGRKCALERMTFEALMKRTIKNIGEYYKEGN